MNSVRQRISNDSRRRLFWLVWLSLDRRSFGCRTVYDFPGVFLLFFCRWSSLSKAYVYAFIIVKGFRMITERNVFPLREEIFSRQNEKIIEYTWDSPKNKTTTAVFNGLYRSDTVIHFLIPRMSLRLLAGCYPLSSFSTPMHVGCLILRLFVSCLSLEGQPARSAVRRDPAPLGGERGPRAYRWALADMRCRRSTQGWQTVSSSFRPRTSPTI